jgi:shikimate dehydrogenase
MRRLCVIGDPVGHSKSPQMHKAALSHLGLLDLFSFEKVQVSIMELAEFMERVRQKEFGGLSVTMPHKRAIIPLLDELSREAMLSQAVNTVTWQADTLVGHNTDGAGCVNALEAAGAAIFGKRIVIIGAGGAAAAAAISVATKGAKSIHILNRTPEPAEEIAELARYESDTDVTASGLDSMQKALAKSDILINATPVGMEGTGDISIVDPRLLRKDMTVLDMVYEPAQTQLAKDAKKAGARTISGIDMLLQQGAIQFRLFTGHEAPVDVMRGALIKKKGGRKQ